ncbi:FAD-dependent oxidoreductase [Tenggerimyces flavus]|uniref:FAD-dependent oxidoreductase n=1 Tax=Tenggerimyces flavus TaxID=1708749 RepID=A0ABV7YJI9_9ACTN|nr:FAD-dependent oxidoreductase [Tenggerimyces flavus]
MTQPPRDPAVTCCVVGGGPGGLMTAYLLARAGVDVALFETHQDFDREFRGDSLHPGTLELLDHLGLADELLTLDHYRARYFRLHTPTGSYTTTDYGRLRTKFNYVALMAQSAFLEFLASKGSELSHFTLRQSTRATGIVTNKDNVVTGVRYQDGQGQEREQPAKLVIAADGRFSRFRRLADLPARPLGASSDLLWFQLPKRPNDPPDADVSLYFGVGHYVALLGRTNSWQVGYTIPKGAYAATRERGVEPIRAFVEQYVPWLSDRTSLLTDWSQITLLSVEIARVDTWHRPGLLLIGDAAHVISPVGGNGILMAIQDAIVTANVLVPRLRNGGTVDSRDLARIQNEREPAIVAVQRMQVRVEQRTALTLQTGKAFRPSPAFRLFTRVPYLRGRSARANAYGPRTPRLDPTLLA